MKSRETLGRVMPPVGNSVKAGPPPARRDDRAKGAGGGKPLSALRLFLATSGVILLVIAATEVTESLLAPELSEWGEGLLHVVVLFTTLTPVFFFFWYRPLMAQMAERRRTENEVRNLSHRLLVAAEEERRRLARDLHDDFGQKLTSLQMRLENFQKALRERDPAGSDACAELVAMTRDLGEELRFVTSELRPDILDDLGIVCAIESYCEDLRKQSPELHLEFSSRGLKQRLEADVETVLYRICQELLNNVAKHACAERAQVSLTLSHPKIILTVQDDGCGFSPDIAGRAPRKRSANGGFGLISIRERAASVGGTVRVRSSPRQGTRVRVEIPVAGGKREG